MFPSMVQDELLICMLFRDQTPRITWLVAIRWLAGLRADGTTRWNNPLSLKRERAVLEQRERHIRPPQRKLSIDLDRPLTQYYLDTALPYQLACRLSMLVNRWTCDPWSGGRTFFTKNLLVIGWQHGAPWEITEWNQFRVNRKLGPNYRTVHLPTPHIRTLSFLLDFAFQVFWCRMGYMHLEFGCLKMVHTPTQCL
jgi:hypothetical protein